NRRGRSLGRRWLVGSPGSARPGDGESTSGRRGRRRGGATPTGEGACAADEWPLGLLPDAVRGFAGAVAGAASRTAAGAASPGGTSVRPGDATCSVSTAGASAVGVS